MNKLNGEVANHRLYSELYNNCFAMVSQDYSLTQYSVDSSSNKF